MGAKVLKGNAFLFCNLLDIKHFATPEVSRKMFRSLNDEVPFFMPPDLDDFASRYSAGEEIIQRDRNRQVHLQELRAQSILNAS